jgi:Restriction endonuclease fold toxin 5
MRRQLILALVVLGLAAVRPRRPGGGGDDGGSGRPRDGEGEGGRPRSRAAPVDDLEGAFAQVDARLTAGTITQAGAGTPAPRRPGSGTQVQNAGQWEAPSTPRHHGNPFNAEYEAWVRRQTGGPEDGTEYLVRHGDEQAYFDAADVQDRDGVPTEVLLDAKGRYENFVDPETGSFREWWADSERSGLPKELEQAERQVRVANGRPVEWWCAEQATADAFNEAFADNPRLNGRIVAVYKPPT